MQITEYTKNNIHILYISVTYAYSYYISVIWRYKIIVWWCSAKYMAARVEEVLERIYRNRIVYRKTIKNNQTGRIWASRKFSQQDLFH